MEQETSQHRGHRLDRLLYYQNVKEFVQKGQFDSLVIVSKYDPETMLKHTLPLLSKSRPFVIYSPFQEVSNLENHSSLMIYKSDNFLTFILQPLSCAYLFLRQERCAVNLFVQDVFMREYQTLHNRTHPQMTTSGSSGFLLSGITVSS
jgi:tRNA (adenine-N(1)-)-methyltransferase non-catalytic subunit